MVWSIYKDSSKDYNDWERNYAAFYVDDDMVTNHFPNRIKFLHDGIHTVHFDHNFVELEVINGQWAAGSESKILNMTEKTYWGPYVEGFEKREGKLYVIMGS